MNTVFDLYQTTDELPERNKGSSRLRYIEVPPSRDCTGTAWPSGQHIFSWSVSDADWWLPNQSFLRVRWKLTTAAGNVVSVSDDVAPAMNMVANLYNAASLELGGHVISRCDNLFAQVSSLDVRMNSSGPKLESLGAALEDMNPRQSVRQSKVCFNGGELSQQVNINGHPRANQGFDPPAGANSNTIQVALVDFGKTGTITFGVGAGAALPNLQQTFTVGDSISYLGKYYLITGIPSATVLNVVSEGGVANTGPTSTNEWYYHQAGHSFAEQRNAQESIFVPPLGIMRHSGGIPSAKFRLVMNPASAGTYMNRAVESLLNNKTQTTDFLWVPESVYYYAAVISGPRYSQGSYFLPLTQIRAQSQQFQNNTSLQSWQYDISSQTTQISLAFQRADAQNTTVASSTKFLMGPIENAGDEFKYPDASLALSRHFINYDGEQKPSPDVVSNYELSSVVTGTSYDYFKHLYAQTQIANGSYFDPAAGESFEEFLERGPYISYRWPRSGLSESTRVSANFSFATAPTIASNAILFDHAATVVLVETEAGETTRVVVR